MRSNIYTRFYSKPITIILTLLCLVPNVLWAQSFDPLPDICYTSTAPINLSDYVGGNSGFSMSPATHGTITSTAGGHPYFFTPNGTPGTVTFTYLQGGNPTQPMQINAAPVIPTNITSTPDKYCEDYGNGTNTITLLASGGSGTTYKWYDVGSILIGTGNSIVLTAPSTPTLYQVSYSNACGESLPFNYTVIPVPISQSDLDIQNLNAIYCNDDPDANLTGVPNSMLGLSTVFTPAIPGITDNGGGSCTISPTTLGDGSYSLTYTINKDNCTLFVTEPFQVLPPMNVSFSGLSGPVCAGDGIQNLLGNPVPPPGTGTFTGSGITDYGDGTADFDPTGLDGTYTIRYTYIDGNACESYEEQTIVVHPLPVLNILNLDAHYCNGDAAVTLTGTPNTLPGTRIFSVSPPSAGLSDNGDGTASWNPTLAGVNTYDITYTYVNGINTCTDFITESTEVHSILSPTITGTGSPCQNVEITYTTEAGMNNYNWVPSAGATIIAGGTGTDNTITISWTSSGAETLSIEYNDSNGGCLSSTTTRNITVKAEPTVTLDPFANVCLQDAAFTITGGNAAPGGGTGVYDVDGTVRVDFDPIVEGVGAHTITYTYTNSAPNSCSNTAVQGITVLYLAASISNLDADYCRLQADETIIGNNTDGAIGSFSISPIPTNAAILVDNGNNSATFSPLNCDPADYNTVFTITYTYTNGTCTATDQTTTFVYGSPTVTINGLAAIYCTDDAIDAFTGSPTNGIFSTTALGGLTDDGAGNGTFDPGVAGSGNYNISYYYEDAAGCNNTDVVPVIVNQTPDAVLVSSDADDIICAGASVTFTASDNEGVADTYEFFVDGNSVQGPGAADTYITSALSDGETVTANVSVAASTCNDLSTGITMTVIDSPIPIITGDDLVCEGDIGDVYTTEPGMNNYSWNVIGGIITAGGGLSDETATVTWNTPGAQSISVNYENSNACSAASPTVLNVNVIALPANNLAISDDEICSGDVALITLSASEAGVTYQLRLDSDDSPVGGALNGTGGDLNFILTPLNTTTYNMIASNATGCVVELLDKPIVTANPNPIAGLISSDVDNSICLGESIGFTASGGDVYEFFVEGNSVQGPSIVDVYTTTALLDGEEVTVEASFGLTSCTDISAGIITTVNPLPIPTISGDQDVCLNVNGFVYTTEIGMSNYTWNIVGGTIDAGGTATDHTATVTWNSSGAQSISVNYNNANGCTAVLPTSLAVHVNDLPDNSLVVNDDEICIGEQATVILESSISGVTYQLRLDATNANVGPTLNGNGGDLNFPVSPIATTLYNILASDGNGCSDQLLDKPTIIVNPLPVPVLTSSDADNIICIGESVTFTASGGDEYEFFVDGASVQGPSNVDVYTTIGLLDGEEVTVEVANAAACTDISSGIITTVHDLPIISLTGSQEVCLNEPGMIYTTDVGMSNYAWSVVGGIIEAGGSSSDHTITITWTSLGAQSVSVNYENANSCEAVSPQSLAINVNDLPDDSFTFTDVVICEGDIALIEQSNSVLNVSYQLRLDSDNSSIGAPIMGTGLAINFPASPLVTSTYNVLATNASSCDSEIIDKAIVYVNPLPDNSLGVLGSTACFGEPGTIIIQASELGVSYQLRLDSDDSHQGVALIGTGADLTYNVAPIATTIYNILATDGNSCSVEMATKPVVTINPLPDNSLVLSDEEICLGETASIILFNSLPGISYQLRLDSDDSPVGTAQPGNGANLLFNVTPINTTSYNVLATNADMCSNEMIDKSVVQVNPTPDATLGLTSPSACAGETSIITLSNSVAGVTYQLRLDSDNTYVGAAIPGNGNDVNFSVSPTSTTVYNVLATSSNSCSVELITKSTVTIFNAPDAHLVVDDANICFGETASITLYNSELGVTYQLRLDSDNSNVGIPVSGTGGNILLNVNTNVSSTYNVYAYNVNACAVELIDKSNVTVNPLPDHTLTVGDDAICNGEQADIVLFNSVLGVNYQLRLDSDDSNIGSSLSGNGGTLIFHDSPLITSTYNILAFDANACSIEINDKSIVQVYPLANNTLTVSDPIVCFSENAIISVDNSEPGVNYQLRLDSDNSNVGAAIPGNSGTITFNVAVTTTTLFNVLATTSNSCDIELLDRALVTVNPSPDETLAVSSPSICENEIAEIKVYTSEIGVSYQLRLDSDNTLVGTPLNGNGGDLSFYVTPSASTLYNVLATGGNSCSVELNQKVDVTVYLLPDASLIVDDATICATETASILLYNSEIGISYQLRLDSDDSPIGTTQIGDGNILSFDVNPTSSTVYNIYATTTDACSIELLDKSVVSVLPTPDLDLTVSSDEICVGETAMIIVANSELGVSYQLRLNDDNSLVGTAILGTGFDLEFSVTPTLTTLYNVLATGGNACAGSLVELSTVTVNPLPAQPVITASGPTTFCEGGSVDLTASLADEYLWSTGETSQTITVSTAGTYTVMISDVNTCASPISDPIIINVNPLPSVSFSGLDISFCHDALPITLTGSPIPTALTIGIFSGPGITDNGDGTAVFDPVAAGIGGPYDIVYAYSDENTCMNSDTQQTTVFPAPSISISGLEIEYCVNASPVLITGSEAPFGEFSGPGITDNANGTAIFDPVSAGIGGPYDIEYSFTNTDGCSNTVINQTQVYDLPTVTFGTLNPEYCVDHSEVILTGNHAPEGSFSGVGVFDNGDGTAIFNPSSAGIGGPYEITYTFTDGNLCSNTSIQQTIIHALPTVSFSGLNTDYCIDGVTSTLVGNHAPEGIFTGLGITDNGDGTASFDPALAGTGLNIQITYIYSDPNFCDNSEIQLVNVHALPIVQILGLESNYCVNDGDILITGYPLPDAQSSGYFTGSGVTDNGDGTALFSPSSLIENNIYSISYTYTDLNSCESTYFQDVNIIELPDAPIATDVDVCFGETVPDLTASGEPGFQLIWYNSLGDSIHSGNTYATEMTNVGVYEYSVTQIHTITGCESNSTPVSLNIIELPIVELPPYADVCIYDFIIYLNTGTPSGGTYTGTPGIILLPTGDYIFHPEYAGAGIHDIIYTYTNPISGCYDTAMQTITVHDRPLVEILDLEAVYCVSGAEVTINGNHTGYGIFSGPGIMDNGDGSAQFSPPTAGLGYHDIVYQYQDINTGCFNQDTATTLVEGAPQNVSIIQISDPEICVNAIETVTLEAIGGNGTWVNWFETSCGGNSPEILTANGDSSLIVIPAPEVSTYYFAQWETECGVSDLCADNYIVVNQIPTLPDTAWATPDVVCNEDQDSIALFITGGNYGSILEWTQDSCTGLVVGQSNGDPLHIATPDTTTVYFANWINDCGESGCTESVRVRVTPPAEEVAIADADSNFFCRNTLNKLQLRAFGGRGDSVIWHYDSLGLYPLPLDSILNVMSASGDTIEIIPPTVNTIYYPFRATPCEQIGGNIAVAISVFADPIAPDTAYTFPSTICFGATDSITLIVEGGNGVKIEWYAGDCNTGVFLGNGNDFKVPPPTVNTTYFAKWVTPCGVSECQSTELVIYPPTIDPINIISDTNALCAGNLSEIQLVMNGGSGDSVVWFSDSCGGIELDPSSFYYQSPMRDTIIIPAPNTDTTFYAYWATPCEVSECVNIDITVYPQPIIMDSVYASHNDFCSGSVANITLTAVGGEGDEITWTKDSCDGPIVAVTNLSSISIPSPQDTTVYYAKWKTICDSTECKTIQINVPPTPLDPIQLHVIENLICDNTIDSITLVLEGGNGYEAVWFYGPYCGNDTIPEEEMIKLSPKGDSIRIARPAQSQVFTANWASYNGVCGSSECVSLDVFVYVAPQASFQITGGVECENTLLQFSPTSDAGTGLITQLVWDFGDGVVVDTNLQVDLFHAYENSGEYLVELMITNTYGCKDTTWVPLTISNGPTADFTYETSCLGTPIQFTDQSISAVDSIAAWFWNFNDPTSLNDTSSLQNPTYTYTEAGVYEVILTITDTSGCTGEIIQDVFVSPAPTAFFKLGNASCQNVPVLFSDSSFTENNEIATWVWNFGDGSDELVINAPDSPDVYHSYENTDEFTVSLTVYDTLGCQSAYFYRYFEVRPTPIAGFMHTDTACQTGIIHFFDTTYNQAGTNSVAWQWSFDDGSFAYNENPVHSYIETGQLYDVEMIVTDEFGCQDTAMNTVEVKPSMEIAFSSNIVCQGEETQLIADLIQPENDQVAEWQWFFGDNTDTIVNSDTIYHQYPSGGTFYATLIGVDEGGCETIVINQAVNVYPGPVVDYFIPEASCSDPSKFYNHSIANADSIILYHFEYGDGTYETFNSSNYPDPLEHSYPAGANEYTAIISLTNSNGCMQTAEFVVERESCIDLSFDFSNPACLGQEVQFVNQSYVNNEGVTIDSIIWNFGDGVIYELPIEEGDTVYHTYTTVGMKDVEMKLIATNEFGDFTVGTTKGLYINETPNAAFDIQENLMCSRDSIHFIDHSWVFNGEIVGWRWNFGDQYSERDTSYIQNPAYRYEFGGEYQPSLMAISDSGCTNSTDREININPSPMNHLFADRDFGCGPENEIFFRDTALLEEGDIAYYQWIFGFNDTVYTDVDSLHHQLEIGNYNVISRVVSELGCSGVDSISGFNVYDKPIADFGYYPEDPSIREPEVYFNDRSLGTVSPVEYYHWDFGDENDTIGLDPMHIYQDTGSFRVILTIQDQNGCVDTISNTLYVDPVFSFYMPNAFSPNDNGLNDAFGPVGSYFQDTDYEFLIYSRWGELLFETRDPMEHWKGDFQTSSQNQVPLGVYSWIIRVKDSFNNEHVYKGIVTLVR